MHLPSNSMQYDSKCGITDIFQTIVSTENKAHLQVPPQQKIITVITPTCIHFSLSAVHCTKPELDR